MKLLNKVLLYVFIVAVMVVGWFGFVCPAVMTIPDDYMAIVGALLYVVGALGLLYGTIFYWKKELKSLIDFVKDGF